MPRHAGRHLWLPAVAFLGSATHGGAPAVGAVVVDFSSVEAVVTPLPMAPLTPHDLAALKQQGRYKFLRDMPPCPPPGAEAGLVPATAMGED